MYQDRETKTLCFFNVALKIPTMLGLLFLCLLFSPVFAQVDSNQVNARRAALEAELALLENEINGQRSILEDKQRERVSLERDIAILDAKIEKARLSIRARNLTISALQEEIGDKEITIVSLSEKLDRERESLSQILRRTNEIDQFSFAEIVLSGNDISKFFEDLDSFNTLKSSLRESYQIVVEDKTETEEQKKSLEGKVIEERDLRQIQELEKRRIEEQEAEKQQILKVSKGVEATYQQIIKDKEKSAAQIRAELFALRDTAAIPFGKAVEYATRAGAKTGVRPALILGIITQESNLGENTGQCIVKDLQTGSGVGKNTGRYFAAIMKAPRDTVPFSGLASRIGFDPLNTVVSCPPSYGYGGAMGPAQFIPSTWILYEDRIAELTGHNPPNPWDPEDAFMASATLLADNGAKAQTYATERLAALRYFAGWVNATKKAYAFYGDDVMELATKYQNQIEILERN